MSDDDAARPASLRVASGVVLCASATGLVATFADGRLKRIDLHDRVEEGKLVAALTTHRELDPRTLQIDVQVLVDERVLIGERKLDVTDLLGLRVDAVARAPTKLGTARVIIGWLFDDDFHESVAAALAHGDRVMVLCASSSGLWLASDDATTRPCVRCALLFDTDLARNAAAFERLAATTVAAAPSETLRIAEAWLARWGREDCPVPTPGRAIVFDVRDGTSRWETYGAHPSCTCRARQPSTAGAPADLDVLAAGRRRFSPVMCVAGAAPARAVYRGSRKPWPSSPSDFGVAMAGPPDADLRALAEGIERFCMLHAPPDVRDTPASALEGPHLEDDAIASLLFRPEERSTEGFPFPAHSASLALDWSWATHAVTHQRVLLPTSIVGRVPSGSTRLVHGTSNGYACHRSADAAARAALLEVVERDAVLLGWYLARALPQFELDDDFGVRGRVYAWLATQDIQLPVVLMAALLVEGGTRVACAAGTSFDEALGRASSELRALAMSRASATRADGQGARDPRSAHLDGDPRAHQRYFDDVGRIHLADLAAKGPRADIEHLRARWPAGDASLTGVLAAVTRARLDPWLVQRAVPEVFGGGWHVVRAVIPGCVELSWGPPFRRLASPRVGAALLAGERLNPLPHPLA